MSIVRVQGNFNGIGGSIASTVAVTLSAIGSGNLVIGQIEYANDGATILSVVDNQSNNYVVYNTVLDATSTWTTSSFYLSNITNAPTTITVTTSIVVQFLKIMADEFSGTSTVVDPRDGFTGQSQNNVGTGANAATSGSITTTANGELIYGSMVTPGGDPTTIGTGFTAAIANTTIVARSNTEYLIQAAAGSTASTWTMTGGTGSLTTLVTAIKAAGAAPNPGVPPGVNLNSSFI